MSSVCACDIKTTVVIYFYGVFDPAVGAVIRDRRAAIRHLNDYALASPYSVFELPSGFHCWVFRFPRKTFR